MSIDFFHDHHDHDDGYDGYDDDDNNNGYDNKNHYQSIQLFLHEFQHALFVLLDLTILGKLLWTTSK